MPPSLGMMQGWKLREAIDKMPAHEKEIAERIYEYWDYLTTSSTEVMIRIMMVVIVTEVVGLGGSHLFLPEKYADFGTCIWILLAFIGILVSAHLGYLTPKKMIESMPEKKAAFEKLLEEPSAKEVFEKMKQAFNGTDDL